MYWLRPKHGRRLTRISVCVAGIPLNVIGCSVFSILAALPKSPYPRPRRGNSRR